MDHNGVLERKIRVRVQCIEKRKQQLSYSKGVD
jgi:hypothetical protein